MIEIKQNDFKSFFDVPFEVYPKDFPYVSLMKADFKRFLSKENPVFESENDFKYFTAFKHGKLAGRILAHVHRKSNKHFGWNRCYFGFFDCANDLEVAKALLNAAEGFAKSIGCDELTGNFNMTAMQAIGTVTKIHRNYHYTDQVFAPEYIAELLKRCGYESTFPMVTHETNVQTFDWELLLGEKQKGIQANPDFELIPLRKADLHEIIEIMRLCLNDGFSDNPMFVPLTKEEIYFQAKDMMLILDREISVVAKYKGKPVGAIVCIPNLNPLLKKIRSRYGLSMIYHFIRHKMQPESAVIIYYSVFKEFHSQGLNGLMMYQLMTALKRRGYKTVGGTWISLENKASLRQAEKVGGVTMHELALFRKKL